MTYQEIKAMVEDIGLPCAYYQFNKDTAQPCPFICWFFTDDNDVLADNSNYQTIRTLVIELCTDNKDFAAEKTVEDVLRAHDMVWSWEETYIDSEQMYEVIYTMDVVITEEETNG